MPRIAHKHDVYKLLLCIIVLMFIITTWSAGIYLSSLDQIHIKDIKTQPFNEIFTSLNALFAGLAFFGLIMTIWIQYENLKKSLIEMRRSSDANLAMATEAKDNATLDLFAMYCSEYFQKVKTASHNVLISCVNSKQYCDFVISSFFVVGKLELNEQIANEISRIYPSSAYSTFGEFKALEQADRYKLDELINFFALLANRNGSKEIISNCDFFYSWWRPLFWMVAILQQERYDNQKEFQEYCTEPYFCAVLEKLDYLYNFTPFENSSEMWKHFLNHPKIQEYGIDPRYVELSDPK